jgi:S-adenosylmethionine hydrolase
VVSIDRFGNVVLDLGRDELAAAGFDHGERLEVSGPRGHGPASYVTTFGDVAPGETVLYADSSGWITVAVNGGNAAEALGVSYEDMIDLTRWPRGR